VDIKIPAFPGVTIILPVAETTHHRFEALLVPPENLDLIFHGITKVETWEKRPFLLPQLTAIREERRLNASQPLDVNI
jgi:hypothetical protein